MTFPSLVRRALLDRRAVLGVIVLLALTTAIGLVFPQHQASTPGNSGSAAFTPGPNQLFTGWWFRPLALVASLQLLVATVRLFGRDLRRIRRSRGPAGRAPFNVKDADGLRRFLRLLRYVRMRTSPATERYVRNVWGYLGPGLLHLGMLAVILSVLLLSLTTSSGVLTLTEGATVSSAVALEDAREGPLGPSALLTSAIRLDDIEVEYWSDGEPRRVTGTYSFIAPGASETVRASTNKPAYISGLRVFQDPRVGYGYGVTLTRDDNAMTSRLVLPLPGSADDPAYVEVQLDNGDMLRAKVTHDPRAPDGNPLLTLRLERGGSVVGEQTFSGTGVGALGDTSVSVDIATRWSIVALERSYGMTALFVSFFGVLLGALLIYTATPRELTLVKHVDGTVTADWHAARFAALYAAEERALRAAASGTGVDADD